MARPDSHPRLYSYLGAKRSHPQAPIPLYTLSPSKPSQAPLPVLRDEITSTKTDKWLPTRSQTRLTFQPDRFIPPRCNQNFAASNYVLTKIPPPPEAQDSLELFEQVADLRTSWRKKLMKKAMKNYNVFPRIEQQRVLNIGEPFASKRKNYNVAEETCDDNSTDGFWKTRARYRPLVGLNEVKINIRDLGSNISRGLLDWSSTNLITMASGKSIVIIDGSSKLSMSRPGFEQHKVASNRIRVIKWNNAGTLIALGTIDSQFIVHNLEVQKIVWSTLCHCTVENTETDCEILCVAWTKDDAEIVMGCSRGRLTSYSASMGTVIDGVIAHADMVLAIAFSPNNRYLVTTGLDKAVRVLTWPDLMPHLTIGYFEPVQALAWHPWETDMLCVGGGYEDASLSLWDIHRQTSLGYRRVPFSGVVKHMEWNKLSGELLIQWNYRQVNSIRGIVPVLASLDRVVDVVSSGPRPMDIVWNPDGTQVAMRSKHSINVWNFFGNETSNWHDSRKRTKFSEGNEATSAGRTRNFEKYIIR